MRRERQAEVERIRALRVVETKMFEVAPLFEGLVNNTATSENLRMAIELNDLASNRRVGGIHPELRQRLESMFLACPSLAPGPTRPAAPQGRSSAETHRHGQNASPARNVPPHSPPSAGRALLMDQPQSELESLAGHAAVTAQLSHSGFVDTLSRLLRSRLSDEHFSRAPGRAALRSELVAAVANRRRRMAPSRRTPTTEALMGWAAHRSQSPASAQAVLAHAGGDDSSAAGMAAGSPSLRELQDTAGATFNLLLSLQRTLNHQVAASLSPQPAAPQGAETDVWVTVPRYAGASAVTTGLGACIVCTTKNADTVFYRCGHLCACASCAHTLAARGLRCPICRAPIDDVVRVFLACAAAEEPAGVELP